ncbi:MAG TPA: hypothetical protein VEC35_19340 [Noviherbaspirillum sp.]|nr:hypothetical protein [Noviherbaspirillum sp.]
MHTNISIVRPRRAGFVFVQMLAGVALAATLIGGLGYTYFSITKANATAQLRTHSGNLLTQAAAILVTEAANIDADDFLEPQAGATASGDGYEVPAASGAPKADSWGGKLRYCPWDNGSANASAGRLAGDTPGSSSSAILAVISAGPDKSFQTTCAQAKAGTVQGDDGMRVMSDSQVRQGIGGTAYLGDPVEDITALGNLQAAAIKPGQLRVVKATGTTYVNKTGNAGLANWTALAGGGGGGGGVTTAASYAALPACSTDGQLALTTNNRFLYACTGGTWLLATSLATSSDLNVSTASTTVSGMKGMPLATTTAFTVSGGTAPYSYSLNGGSLLSPVVADTSTNSVFKLTSGGSNLPNATSSNSYTVTVTDSVGFSKNVSLNLNVIANSDGYALRNYYTPSVAGPPPASCPAGWAGVPAMNIPYPDATTQAACTAKVGSHGISGFGWDNGQSKCYATVAAFCVQQFKAVNSGGFAHTATPTYLSTSAPWDQISFGGAVNQCATVRDATGTPISGGGHLIYDSQWLAIAHNMVMNGINWEDGMIGVQGGSNRMFAGLSNGSGASTTVSANYGLNLPATSDNVGKKREKILTTGATIYDIGGNASEYTYLDTALGGTSGGAFPNGNFAEALVAAPFLAGYRGMGTYPAPMNANFWAPVRGGHVYAYAYNNGPFTLSSVDPGTNNMTAVSFRCAK